jgi:hypothetical protein
MIFVVIERQGATKTNPVDRDHSDARKRADGDRYHWLLMHVLVASTCLQCGALRSSDLTVVGTDCFSNVLVPISFQAISQFPLQSREREWALVG